MEKINRGIWRCQRKYLSIILYIIQPKNRVRKKELPSGTIEF